MKRTIYLSLLLSFLLNNSLSAQTGARFGFKGGSSLAMQYGVNSTDETINVNSGSRLGFAGGVFVYFPITESVGIQQELLYAMKGSRQDVTISVPVSI